MTTDSMNLFEMYLAEAESTPFSGWDFGYLIASRRMVEGPLGWNYHNVVLPWLRRAETMLDMGTAGGEVLSRFAPLPPITHATEQYEPNVPIARDRLEPLGVKVVQISEEYPNNEILPFDDAFFDLITSRHESYHPPELLRLLRPRGSFITQQVGLGLQNLKKALTGKEQAASDWSLRTLVRGLESAGFIISRADEGVQRLRFHDIGAIAYYVRAIPWIIEDVTGVQDFSVEGYRDKLWQLHLQIEKDGFFDCSYASFIIVAHK